MLSDAKLRSLKASEKIYTAGDSDGLYIEVRPTGRKYWRYRIQIEGKVRKMTLGEYPAVGLSEARSKRDSVRNDLLSGKDPNAAQILVFALYCWRHCSLEEQSVTLEQSQAVQVLFLGDSLASLPLRHSHDIDTQEFCQLFLRQAHLSALISYQVFQF